MSQLKKMFKDVEWMNLAGESLPPWPREKDFDHVFIVRCGFGEYHVKIPRNFGGNTRLPLASYHCKPSLGFLFHHGRPIAFTFPMLNPSCA